MKGSAPLNREDDLLLEQLKEGFAESVGITHPRKKEPNHKNASQNANVAFGHSSPVTAELDHLSSLMAPSSAAAAASSSRASWAQCTKETTTALWPTLEPPQEAVAEPEMSSPPQERERSIASEARQLGLDPSFFAALPRDMALELLDEKRRENELLYDNDDTGHNDSAPSRSMTTAAGPTNPAVNPAEQSSDHPFVDEEEAARIAAWLLGGQQRGDPVEPLLESDRGLYDDQGRALQDELAAVESLRSTQQQEEDEDDGLAREDILALKDVMTAALSFSSASSSSSSSRATARRGPGGAVPVRTAAPLASADAGTEPRMMEEAIRNLMHLDAPRATELRRLYGLSFLQNM